MMQYTMVLNLININDTILFEVRVDGQKRSHNFTHVLVIITMNRCRSHDCGDTN